MQRDSRAAVVVLALGAAFITLSTGSTGLLDTVLILAVVYAIAKIVLR